MLKIYIRYFLSILILLFFTSCSDNIVESTQSIDEIQESHNVQATFSSIQNNVFNKSCAFSGCHVSGTVNPDLSGNSYSNIVNMQSSNGLLYIDPNNPDGSYLLQKVIGSSIINGSRMPLNNSPLSAGSIRTISEWISNGANNN